jgi:hypothetical protein
MGVGMGVAATVFEMDEHKTRDHEEGEEIQPGGVIPLKG